MYGIPTHIICKVYPPPTQVWPLPIGILFALGFSYELGESTQQAISNLSWIRLLFLFKPGGCCSSSNKTTRHPFALRDVQFSTMSLHFNATYTPNALFLYAKFTGLLLKTYNKIVKVNPISHRHVGHLQACTVVNLRGCVVHSWHRDATRNALLDRIHSWRWCHIISIDYIITSIHSDFYASIPSVGFTESDISAHSFW